MMDGAEIKVSEMATGMLVAPAEGTEVTTVMAEITLEMGGAHLRQLGLEVRRHHPLQEVERHLLPRLTAVARGETTHPRPRAAAAVATTTRATTSPVHHMGAAALRRRVGEAVAAAMVASHMAPLVATADESTPRPPHGFS